MIICLAQIEITNTCPCHTLAVPELVWCPCSCHWLLLSSWPVCEETQHLRHWGIQHQQLPDTHIYTVDLFLLGWRMNGELCNTYISLLHKKQNWVLDKRNHGCQFYWGLVEVSWKFSSRGQVAHLTTTPRNASS